MNAREARRRAGRVPLTAGAVLVGLAIAAALLSLVWTPMDPTATDAINRLQGPSTAHPLGTDTLGRDVASQLLAGARPPLLVGAGAVAISFALGLPYGLLAALAADWWRVRWADTLLMRASDVAQAFPALLLAIVLAAVYGGGTATATIALGIGAAPGVARIVRSGARQVLSREYALAARASGRGAWFTAVRHVLPNIRGGLVVQATVGFAMAVLAEAGLSYLGLGTAAPAPSWGRLLQESQGAVYVQPLLVVWPALAIGLTVLGLTLCGDGLRDRFDAREEA